MIAIAEATIVTLRTPWLKRHRSFNPDSKLQAGMIGIVDHVFPSGLLRISFEVEGGMYTVDLKPSAVKIAR